MALFGESKRSKRLNNEAIRIADALKIPRIEAMRLVLDQYVSAGDFTPDQAAAVMQEASKMEDFQVDPLVRESQMGALQKLADISERGLTETDKAMLQKVRSQDDIRSRGAREAILQNARARGIGGSGVELASQLISQQGAASDEAMRSQDIAAMAEQRALEALAQSGALGGQIRAQDLGEAQARAAAEDAINRFNAQNLQNQRNLNVESINAARAGNLANRQNVMNQNTALRNQQQIANKALYQQDYQNRLQKAGMQTGLRQGAAAQAQAAQQAGINMATGLLGGTIMAGGSALGGYLSNPNTFLPDPRNSTGLNRS